MICVVICTQNYLKDLCLANYGYWLRLPCNHFKYCVKYFLHYFSEKILRTLWEMKKVRYYAIIIMYITQSDGDASRHLPQNYHIAFQVQFTDLSFSKLLCMGFVIAEIFCHKNIKIKVPLPENIYSTFLFTFI